MRVIEKILYFAYGAIFIGILLFQLWFILSGVNVDLSSTLYWLILLALLFNIWRYKKTSEMTLKWAFALFIIGALLTVVGLQSVAEVGLRVSLIFWLVGLIQALVECIHSERNTKE